MGLLYLGTVICAAIFADLERPELADQHPGAGAPASDLHLLRHLQGVVYLDSEVPDCEHSDRAVDSDPASGGEPSRKADRGE